MTIEYAFWILFGLNVWNSALILVSLARIEKELKVLRAASPTSDNGGEK